MNEVNVKDEESKCHYCNKLIIAPPDVPVLLNANDVIESKEGDVSLSTKLYKFCSVNCFEVNEEFQRSGIQRRG